jgi:hypothetical protein
MRAGAVLILLGITAAAAYSVGRQNAPSNSATAAAMTFQASTDPVALYSPATPATPVPLANPSRNGQASSAKAELPDIAVRQDSKHKVETALTAAAIAAIIVQASRDQYHAGGRPCACPDDTMRNGRACGGRSAYSRPGGAAPLCYPSDVPAAMIQSYRQRTAAR